MKIKSGVPVVFIKNTINIQKQSIALYLYAYFWTGVKQLHIWLTLWRQNVAYSRELQHAH